MSKKIKECFTVSMIGNTVTVCIGVLLFLAVSNIGSVKALWDKALGVVSPFIYAFALAFVLNRPMMWFERKVFDGCKKKRLLSVLTVYAIFLIICSSLITSVMPQLVQSISYIVDSIPGFLKTVSDIAEKIISEYHWNQRLLDEVDRIWKNFMSSFTQLSLSVLPGILSFSFSLGNGVIKVVMVLIISLYMLMGKDRLLFQIKKRTYAYCKKRRADRLVIIANRSSEIFSGFIIGKMIDSAIIGLLAFIGMLFIYPPYTVLIAVVIGVTNMIPFFGPFIGAIPSIFILLMVNPITAFVFTIFVFVLQQLDGNIIGPKILGDSLGLSPIWVLAGILVGNGLFGIVGMLIGVPTFAVLYWLTSENIKNRLRAKGIKADYNSNEVIFDKGDAQCGSEEK